MSARNSDDIKEDQLKVFEEIEIEEDEEDEDLEDDSIDKDVTIDEYIEDDFRNGFDFFGFLNLVKFELKLTLKKRLKMKPNKYESIRHLYLGFG